MHDVWEGVALVTTSGAAAGFAVATRTPPLLVAVPLYRSPELVAPLAAALIAMADELRALDATVLLIDDSPEDPELGIALDSVMPALSAALHVERTRNPANFGFVRSVNSALARGRDTRHDVLLLNSDALPRAGAFAEMVAVAALDPMTAVVSPRSDNATICNSPEAEELRSGGRDAAYAAHCAIERHLPRVSYVPTAVGFCVLIRHAMLREFGLFDEIYGGGYNEENDFVRRCNQRGYRAVLANHAYVHHLGGVSFAHTDTPADEREADNHAILIERYPEYDEIAARWFGGAEFRAQRLLSGLVPGEDGRLRLLFDCGVLRCAYNGTQEHVRALLTAFAARYAARYDIAVLCEEDAFAFHGLDRVSGLRLVDQDEALAHPAAAVMRLGQPFAPEEFARLCDYAAVCGVVMLDTISMDCQQLDHVGLEALWSTMADDIDVIGFNSAFSRDQFMRRFDVPDHVVEFVSRCSSDLADYPGTGRDDDAVTPDAGKGVLLVGNHYPHKHVRETLAALRAAAPDVPVTVLGLDVPAEPGVIGHGAGNLSQAFVDDLYRRAAVVLFPSHYEGFGLPIMHALARRRPVIARDLPSAREIAILSVARDNIHLAGSTDEMVALAVRPPRWRDVTPRMGMVSEGWGAGADAVADAVECALARFNFAVCRRRQNRALARRDDWTAPTQVAGSDAPLPPHGQGFMLGEMIEVTTTRQSFSRRLMRLVSDARRSADIRLEAALDRRGADMISYDLLELLRDCAEGASVTLDLAADDPPAAARAAATILLACGCAVTSVEAGARGIMAHGRYRHDWTALASGPDDDAGFIRHVYRQTLGRSPDPLGARNYLAELRDGLARIDMLRLFLGSSERRSVIAAQIRRLGMKF